MIIGIIAITLWKVEHIVAMKPGERADVGNYTVQFVAETPLTGENYTGRAGQFRIFRGEPKSPPSSPRSANSSPWERPQPKWACIKPWPAMSMW